MKPRSFLEYVQYREALQRQEKGVGPVTSRISLGDGNDLPPFTVSDDANSEHFGKNRDLAPIIRAFKKGGNWGWSKDDSTGEEKPVKISSRKLFLTGGAARDHLTGRRPRHMELVTNSSPDEIYHLLKQNDFGFCQTDPQSEQGKYFWIRQKDKHNRPYSFGIRVNRSLFQLDIFRRTPHGMDGDPESGTHAEDAMGRDFTMNALAILLSNDNGPNKELHDFHGGIHDLLNRRVRTIGPMEDKMREEPSRMLRYARMLHLYGDPMSVPLEDKESFNNSLVHLSKVDPKKVSDELEKAMDRDDTDSRKYLQTLRDMGLLDSLFPGKQLDLNLPKELSEMGDKFAPLAWLLRNNSPEMLQDAPIPPKALKRIMFLIHSKGLSEDLDDGALEDFLNKYRESGVSSRKLKAWAKMNGLDPVVIDAFIQYAQQPRVQMLSMGPQGEQINPKFQDLVDPFTGQPSSNEEVSDRRRQLEWENFRRILASMRI